MPTLVMSKWPSPHYNGVADHPMLMHAVLLHQEMTCNGKPLVPAENLRLYSRNLEVEVGVTASEGTSHLLDFYFLSFRAEEAQLAFKVLPKPPSFHSLMLLSLGIA